MFDYVMSYWSIDGGLA